MKLYMKIQIKEHGKAQRQGNESTCGMESIMQIMEYIDRHRQDEEPCECIILPDGSVVEPLPSHIEKLTSLSGEEKIALNGKMEKNMEPLFFMVEYTGCALVWQTRVVLPSQLTPQQEDTLERLHDAALLSNTFLREHVPATYTEAVRRARQISFRDADAGTTIR